MGQAVVVDLQPAVIEHQTARIEGEMLQTVLLKEIVEDFGRRLRDRPLYCRLIRIAH